MIDKRNCCRCIYIRPRKDNKCIISRSHVADINTHTCDNFKVDIFIQRMEEKAAEKKDDDGSSRRSYRLNYFEFAFV